MTTDTGTDERPTRRRLVAIDDDRSLLRLLAAICEDDWLVETAADGPTGIAMVRSLRPDAVVLDVMMPGMDGYAVLEAIRADPSLDGVVVVMLTALYDGDARRRGTDLGADAWLTKPYDPELLRATLDLLLSGPPVTMDVTAPI